MIKRTGSCGLLRRFSQASLVRDFVASWGRGGGWRLGQGTGASKTCTLMASEHYHRRLRKRDVPAETASKSVPCPGPLGAVGFLFLFLLISEARCSGAQRPASVLISQPMCVWMCVCPWSVCEAGFVQRLPNTSAQQQSRGRWERSRRSASFGLRADKKVLVI